MLSADGSLILILWDPEKPPYPLLYPLRRNAMNKNPPAVRPAGIGAVNTQFTTKKGTSNEWHYYISNRNLTAMELLHHARLEWSVETMHWLLDVHFGEDFCRIEDENIQQNLNMLRKLAMNCIKAFKTKADSKKPISKIMLDCLLDPLNIIPLFLLE